MQIKLIESVFIVIFSIISLTNSSKYTLKAEPSDMKVFIGQPVVLKCRIDIPEGVKKIKLQWSKNMFGFENSTIEDVYKGRVFIPGVIDSGIYDLHFKTTEPNDEGLYACQIDLTFQDNEYMESIIGKGSLEVIEPPKEVQFAFHVYNTSISEFIWQPQPSIIWGLQNYKLRISCLPDRGRPTPQFASFLKNETHPKLKLNVIRFSSDLHNSQIACNILNKKDYLGAQMPQTTAIIRVLYFNNAAILRTNGKMEGQMDTGEVVSFTCISSNTPEATVYYSWFIQYNNPEKISNEYLVENSTSNAIVLKASSKYHYGRLHCVIYSTIQKENCNRSLNKDCAIHLRQEVQASHVLNILYPPKIKTPFENITVFNFGEWVVLSCDVDSNPPASIKWFKTQVGTNKQSRSINWYFQTTISNLIESMTIDNIISSVAYHKFQVMNEHELDIYICEAKSSSHKVYKYVIVAKEEEPTIKIDQPIINVDVNGKASLMCIIESWPRLPISSLKWYHESSDRQITSTERRYIINKRHLMGFESKLFFKSVVNSDYGTYTCSVTQGRATISKQINLLSIRNKWTVYIAIGISSLFCIVILLIVVICVCCRKSTNKQRKNKKTPIQTIMLASPTIDSSIENEIFLNRHNSLPSYQKESGLPEPILLPSNRCFVYRNQPNISHISKLSCGDSRNGQDEKSTTKGNESNRSWDSGVGPDDTVYRNGQLFQNPRGSNCISPFSTLASSNNSIGPINPNRFWQSYQPIELINQQNADNTSNRLSNPDNSNFNGSVHSGYMPPQNDNILSLMGNSNNQSFVCIPIEEYQHHMRILQESQGPPSLRSFSIASYSTNNGNSTFLPNYRPQNGNVSPTDVSVKSNSTNSKI